MRYLHAGPGAGCDFAQNLVQIAIWQAAGRPGISGFGGYFGIFVALPGVFRGNISCMFVQSEYGHIGT